MIAVINLAESSLEVRFTFEEYLVKRKYIFFKVIIGNKMWVQEKGQGKKKEEEIKERRNR